MGVGKKDKKREEGVETPTVLKVQAQAWHRMFP